MRRVLRRIERGPFEFGIAVATIAGCAAYLADPAALRHAALGRVATPALLPYWEALYGIGGLLVVAGMLMLSVRVEVTGLLALAGAVLVNAIAIGHYYGAIGAASVATFTAVGAACVIRSAMLWRGFARHRRREECSTSRRLD